jgi:1-acyl-sn-glycerol-3-phosphate acyltransferase
MDPAKSSKFVPPQPKASLIWAAQRCSGLFAAGIPRFRLVLDSADRERLRALDSSRVVYLPNHPTHADGIALFTLSALVQQPFYYIAAYESFKGWKGQAMAWLGAYSIRRGVGDRDSIAATLKLLEQPACKLVMFPEGGCSYQNDTVMPFREGAVGLSLRTLKKLARNTDPVPDFYLVPISLKYQYQRSMDGVIAKSLKRLEKALGVPQKSPDFYWRLRSVAGALLQRLEQEFDVQPDPAKPPSPLTNESYWNQRIDQLKNVMLLTYEQRVGLEPQPHLPMRERVYKVQAKLEERYETLAIQQGSLDDEAKKAAPNDTYESLYRDTLRLLNFDAIYDGYIAENPTQERFLDILTTMEREVFRIETPLAKAMRIAQVKVGDIINLKDHLADYNQNKDDTVAALTQTVQQTVQANVLAMSRDRHPTKFRL